MSKKGLYVLCTLLWFYMPLSAQALLTNLRCKWIPLNYEGHTLDSLTLIPETVVFYHKAKDQIKFDYNYVKNEFKLSSFPGSDSLNLNNQEIRSTYSDSVFVCFRVIPLNLAKPTFKRDITKLEMSSFKKGFYQEDISIKEEIFSTPGLNKTGSISRGISFGNTQNVFVNSALNLQLDGKLTEDISITAAITDQNIPFQPEGNTQQLQEFDRVYITLDHERWQLSAGDIVLRNKPSYFLQYYKNVQGGAFETVFGSSPDKQGVTTIAASVSKGKFASQSIQAIEGVLGPYRLRGPNNERFIIVLANSERVFLDGNLLVRGYDYDYVIDYNQAEITFTTKHIITRNTRIKVDFEYSDQNYSRGIYTLNHYQNIGKLKVYGNYYNESDNPNNLINLDLQDKQKRLLASIGDSLNLAVIPGADSVAFDPNQILYAKRDTIYNMGQDVASVFIYSTNPKEAFFNVRFTEVGPNQGDYIASNDAVNGRVYKWVAPINGMPRGNYTPVRILPTPRKKQLITVGTSYEIQKGVDVFIEGAFSENDLNRFSKVDSEDDNGKALRLGYNVINREIDILGNYRFNSTLNYEYTDPNFLPIDRYRPIEFDRDWSLPVSPAKAQDRVLNFSVGAAKDIANFFNYRLSHRNREDQLNGIQHYLDIWKKIGRTELRNNFFLLNSEQSNRESQWYRGDIGVKYNLKTFSPGYLYRFDKNKVKALKTDSIIGSAMYFEEHLVYLESNDTARTRFRVDYSYRRDLRPTENGKLGLPETGQTYNAALQTRLGSESDLAIQATYRKLSLDTNKNEETVQARVDWNAGFLNGSFKSDASYSVGTGRELKKIFIFRETLPGQGTHYLREGGRLNDLNDYLEAQTVDQRRYIKIFLPSDEYINAFTNHFSYRLNSTTPQSWRGTDGLKGLASKFSMLSFISIDKKTTDNSLINRFNPFSENFKDEFLISLLKNLRNTVYYNRSNPQYGLEYTYQQNQQKALLANGTETRNIGGHTFLGRLNLNEVLSTQFQAIYGIRENRSNFLISKNFQIISKELKPELSYQPNARLRFTTTYQLALKENGLLPSKEQQQATFNELGLETRVSQVGKRTVSGNFRFVNIDYKGEPNSYIGYEMLNALRPGNNLTWSLNVQQRLSNGLNISLNYDGRKANGVGAVHTGRTQVSVLF